MSAVAVWEEPRPRPTGHASVAVVICAYTEERWDDIVEAVASCHDQSVVPCEVVVVVDHAPALARRLAGALTGARVVENDEAQGLSGARNTGIRATTADIVAFLDDDARARPGWLEGIEAGYRATDVVAVGGLAEPRWPAVAPAWFPPEFGWVVGCSYVGQPEVPAAVRNPIGCNMSFRRRVLDEVGGFTSGIGRVGKRPVGCEETELCLRVHRAFPESRILYDPSVVVEHRVTLERTTPRYFLRRCWAEGISKAIVASLAGANAGLSSERTYVTRVLPQAVLADVGAALTGRDRAAAARAGTIVAGLTMTVAGYVAGSLSAERRRAVRSAGRGPSVVAADAPPALAPGRERLVRVADQPSPDPTSTAALPGPGGATAWPRATVVVPTNVARPLQLARCVASLARLDYPDLEILVVDNRPGPDRDPEPLRLVAEQPGVTVAHQGRPGASAARNQGLALASGAVVAFTDDDTVVDPGWLKALVGRLVGDGVDCVTGLVVPLELETQAQVWFEQYGGFGKGTRPLLHDLTAPPAGAPLFPYAAGMFGSGNNVAFTTSALRELGGFDEHLGPGTPTRAGEDLALFVATLWSGRRIAYEPAAVVHHAHRRTYDELRTQVHDYGVGLTAMLTALVAEDPRHLVNIARRLPAGARLVLSPRSAKNAGRRPGYPSELARLELLGMAKGPAAYWRARRAWRGAR